MYALRRRRAAVDTRLCSPANQTAAVAVICAIVWRPEHCESRQKETQARCAATVIFTVRSVQVFRIDSSTFSRHLCDARWSNHACSPLSSWMFHQQLLITMFDGDENSPQ